MKKKIFALLLLILPFVFLTACSSQNELDGKYYRIYDGEATALIFEIEGDKGYYYPESVKKEMTVDKERSIFSYTDKGVALQLTYTYNEDGTLSYNGFFGGDTVYKKDSKSYIKELENSKE